MAERYIPKPVEHLGNEQLDAFIQRVTSPLDADENKTLKHKTLADSIVYWYGHELRHPHDREEPYRVEETARRVITPDSAVTELFTPIYGTTDTELLRAYFTADFHSWKIMGRLANHVSTYHPTINDGDIDKDDALCAVMGDRNDPPRSLLSYYFDRTATTRRFPELAERLRDGMKREALLLGISAFVPGQTGYNPDFLPHDAVRFTALSDVFELSDDEIRAAYALAVACQPQRAGSMLSGVLENNKLRTVLLDSDNAANVAESLTAPEAVSEMTRTTFDELVSSNGTKSLEKWETIIDLLDDVRLEAILPRGERTAKVHAMYVARLVNHHLIPIELHPVLEDYLDTDRLIEEANARLEEFLRQPEMITAKDPVTMMQTTAFAIGIEQELDVDLQLEALRAGERPFNYLIDALLKYADVESEPYKRAADLKQRNENYDPELEALLKQYRDIASDECFRFLGVQGFSGDDEETQWLMERAARADKLRGELTVLRERIAAHVTSSPEITTD